MMQRVVVLAAIVALASGASGAYWRQCEPSSTKIKSLKVHDCDPIYSTGDRCALGTYSNPTIEVEFVQPVPEFKDIEWQGGFPYNQFDGGNACIFRNLECPGKANYTQTLRVSAYTQPPSDGSRATIYRMALGKANMTFAEPDYLCVEVNVLLIMWHPDSTAIEVE